MSLPRLDLKKATLHDSGRTFAERILANKARRAGGLAGNDTARSARPPVSARYLTPRATGSDAGYKPPRIEISRSAALTRILDRWDKGLDKVRERILIDFVVKYQEATGPQLEKDFGNGASLLLTRISAWLRLSYLFGKRLALKLKAILIFVVASSGQRYLAEFLEVGGVLTVLAILNLANANEDDKQAALQLLTVIANAGRAYKELICTGQGNYHGLRDISECIASTIERTQTMACDLMLCLGQGNPRYLEPVRLSLLGLLEINVTSAQYLAAQTLKSLMPLGEPSEQFVSPIMLMMRSRDATVQFEARDLCRQLAEHEDLQESLLRSLIQLLRPTNDVLEDLDFGSRASGDLHAVKRSGDLLPKRSGDLHPRRWARDAKDDLIPTAFPQQACAARTLGEIAARNEELAERMLELSAVQGLMFAMANTSHYESQKYAHHTLSLLMDQFEWVGVSLRSVLGPTLYAIVRERSDEPLKALKTSDRDALTSLSEKVILNRSHVPPLFQLQTLPGTLRRLKEITETSGLGSQMSLLSAHASQSSGLDLSGNLPAAPEVPPPDAARDARGERYEGEMAEMWLPFAYPENESSSVRFTQSAALHTHAVKADDRPVEFFSQQVKVLRKAGTLQDEDDEDEAPRVVATGKLPDVYPYNAKRRTSASIPKSTSSEMAGGDSGPAGSGAIVE